MTQASRGIDYDIAIIGGGPAGVCAAYAAGRAGAKTILIESSLRLGGSVSAAMHRCMCGLYAGEPKDPLDTLNDGAQREIVRRMLGKEPSRVLPRQMGKAWVLEFPTAAWDEALREMAAESGAEICLGAFVSGVRREGDVITEIELRPTPSPSTLEEGRGEGLQKISSKPSPQPSPGVPGEGEIRRIGVKSLIDCTGGGAILKLAGEDTYQSPDAPDHRMLHGYAARLAGITGDTDLLRLQIPYELARAVEENALPPVARFTVFYPGPAAGEGICKLAVDPSQCPDSQAEVFLNQVIDRLTKSIPALAHAQTIERSPRLLPRDGLRLRGKSILTDADVLQACPRGGDAVHAWWPIEKWDLKAGPTYAWPPAHRHYDIPADCLRSAAIQNLFAAGACLSATAAAAASSRASGICLATGELAGKLAINAVQRRH
jgi:hypothetical protein